MTREFKPVGAPVSVSKIAELADNTLAREASLRFPQKVELEQLARRRFQNPKPQRRGAWWTLRVYRDVFQLAPATMPVREVQKVAAEYLRPLNQGLETVGSAMPFTAYVSNVYKPVVLPTMAKGTRDRYLSVIKNYLEPTFGGLCLRDITTLNAQRYFSAMASSKLGHESRDKIRDVLSSILGSAVDYQLLVSNPCEAVKLPPMPRGRRGQKPFLYRDQFDAMLGLIAEPYATMIYVAIFTGLRVSELAALRWRNIHPDAITITIDERYCRGTGRSLSRRLAMPPSRSIVRSSHASSG